MSSSPSSGNLFGKNSRLISPPSIGNLIRRWALHQDNKPRLLEILISRHIGKKHLFLDFDFFMAFQPLFLRGVYVREGTCVGWPSHSGWQVSSKQRLWMPCGPPWPVTYPATWWYHVPRTWRMWFEQRHWNWWKLGWFSWRETGVLSKNPGKNWIKLLRWLVRKSCSDGCCFICHGSILGAILCSFYRLGFFLRFVGQPSPLGESARKTFCGLPSSTVIQFSCPHPGFFRWEKGRVFTTTVLLLRGSGYLVTGYM